MNSELTIPTPAQAAFLYHPETVAIWNGLAVGKTEALVQGALTCFEAGGSAILFRRTYLDLCLPGGFYDRARGARGWV